MVEHYHPKNFSLSTPAGSNVFEFVISSDYEIGTTARICEIFAKSKAKILQMYGGYETASNCFVSSFFCDFARANTTVESTLSLIKDIPSTRKIDAFDCKNKLFDQAFFPLVIMQKHRVIMMRIGPLLRIEKRLAQRFASAASVIMFEEGKTYARESIEHYREIMDENVSSSHFTENVIDGLRATGWGLFSFSTLDNLAFDLEIIHPPLSEQEGLFDSRFVIGVAAGVLESLYSVPLKVISSSYDDRMDTLRVKFEKAAQD